MCTVVVRFDSVNTGGSRGVIARIARTVYTDIRKYSTSETVRSDWMREEVERSTVAVERLESLLIYFGRRDYGAPV